MAIQIRRRETIVTRQLRTYRTPSRVQHVTGEGRMRIIVYLMMRSDPR